MPAKAMKTMKAMKAAWKAPKMAMKAMKVKHEFPEQSAKREFPCAEFPCVCKAIGKAISKALSKAQSEGLVTALDAEVVACLLYKEFGMEVVWIGGSCIPIIQG